MPEPVPGLEHRQAAVAQDGDHGPAGPPVRQGPVPHRRADRHRRRRGLHYLEPSDEQAWASGYARIEGTNDAQAHRPLVGTLEEGGVIDPDVLWSCTNCGACVEQCPVDIEHVDHIMDMRRYQTLIESSFPSEAGVMMRNLENRGNPWGVGGNVREDWMKDLDFEVRQVDGAIADDVEYLFWVGCAGAIDDRAKKVTKAVAELLHIAGVEFAVLGSGETCSGDPARRMGNEFLFQQLAKENVETLNARLRGPRPGPRKIVATCPHCFNSIGREYPQLGGDYDVVHHTQLLGQLVEEGRLTPVTPVDRKVTYHDPCFLGRHNKVYTPPREILDSVQGLTTQEMHRCKDRGFCCGAGGARMWMEEKIGKRINVERTEEALELDPDVISTACPFCITMLSRRAEHQEAERRGQGPRRGPGRQPDPAPLDGDGRRARAPSPARRSAPWTTTRPAPARRPPSTTD